MQKGSEKYIYVAVAANAPQNAGRLAALRFKNTEVVTGASDMGCTDIKPQESLPPGTRVVTKGTDFILAESQ